MPPARDAQGRFVKGSGVAAAAGGLAGGLLKIVIHDDAIQELLKSDEMVAVLEEHGQRIAEAAGPGFAVDTDIGPNRARVAVHSTGVEGSLAEAKDQALTRSIDAGR